MAFRFVKVNQVKKFLNEKGIRYSKPFGEFLESAVTKAVEEHIESKTPVTEKTE